MMDEPHIHKEDYLQAEVAVLASSVEEALAILERNGKWNIEELQRIKPEIIALTEPRIISSHLIFQ